jgi:polyisoprenyl-teichoic acid--peptidoglycan teichoic acid transferase
MCLRGKRMKRKIIGMIIAFIVICVITGIIVFLKMTNLNYTKLDKSDASLGIKPQSTPQAIDQHFIKKLKMTTETATTATITTETAIANKTKPHKFKIIALFGVDRRDKKSKSRSDIIMLMTIDYTKKKVKLSSIMRDLYVSIDGNGYTKLNHAYAYGGPQLALKTLNEKFGLAIRDFCTVDFFSMEKIINAVGGIKIDIAKNEIECINSGLGEKENLVKKAGLQVLNGAQVVSYSRIRYIGHGDFDRTGRQRKALKALIAKIKGMGAKDSIRFLNSMLPDIETSLSRLQIIEIALEYFKFQPMTIEEERFPVDGTWKSGNIKGIYYIKSDLDQMKEQLQRYIYQDLKPE